MKKFINALALLLIYALTLSVHIYWLTQKDGLNVDEGLSITLACYNDYMWTNNYDLNRVYTGKEVKEISLCDNESIKNVVEDIYRLWKDNRDSPHTNFYYSLLRLSLAGLKTGNINDIIPRAGMLNIILLTISFFSFYLLLNLVFKENKAISLLAVFCTFISTASISNTLLFRDYQLQETLFIVFAYFFVKFINRRKYITFENTLYLDFRMVSIMAFIAALTFLTGYYSILFIGVFGVYIIYNNTRIKNMEEIQVYIIILIIALSFAQVFYSRYVLGFLSGRATETVRTIFTNVFFDNIRSSTACIINLINNHFFTIPVILFCIAITIYLLLLKQKIVLTKLLLLLILTPFIYTIIVTFIAPYKTLRYSVSVFPFFIFLPLILIYSIKNRYASYIATSLLCVLFSMNLFNNKIENLDKDKPRQYLFNEDTGVPVFVINKSYWKYADLVPYFNDTQIYFFYDTLDDIIVNNKYNRIYLVIEAGELQNIVLPNYEIETEFNIGYFICRKVRKNGEKQNL